MKTIYAISTIGGKTKVEETSYSETKTKITSFKFEILKTKLEKIVKEDNELILFTLDKEKVPSLRRQLISAKKKSFKPTMAE